jgi:hypothetical protein
MLVALCRAGHVSGTGVAEVHAMTGRLVHRWSAREPVSALAETLLPDVFLLDQRSIQERDVFVLGPRIDEAGFASTRVSKFRVSSRQVEKSGARTTAGSEPGWCKASCAARNVSWRCSSNP